ncbi:MAG: hypothetical protein M1827_005149 [Pycnora praestabilis]|nr:MAG: hypothetical protein M1827_005149 [Pycnora praestabilis]
MYAGLIKTLCDGSRVQRVKTPKTAIRYLNRNTPHAVVITDEGITASKHHRVLDKVLTYVRGGGTLVIGLHFAMLITPGVFNNFFVLDLGLPWTVGMQTRTNFVINTSVLVPEAVFQVPLPTTCNMNALLVKNVPSKDQIFVPVFGPPEKTEIDWDQAGVAATRIGVGYVAYIGDINLEWESRQFLGALLGVELL